MTKSRFAAALLAASMAAACGNGGRIAPYDGGTGQGGGGAAGSGGASSGAGGVVRSDHADKVDLLFMIDNSSEMAEKQRLLGAAIPDLVGRLVTPNCIATDGSGAVVGVVDSSGACASGTPEFAPVHDMHIGIVTSSLGGRGASMTCDPSMPNAANPSLPSHNDDRGELINRGGDDEHLVPNAGKPLNFLAWFPNVPANAGAAGPEVPAETALGDANTPGTLLGDFADMVAGVHVHGCGFTAQNEAWYRFLVQPDPFDVISVATNGSNRANLEGEDSVILLQRHAFLRPDSLVAVIVLTDENDEVANPESLDGQGWLMETAPWPGSPTNGAAPRGTIECASNPLDPACLSCAFSSVVGAANYASRCPADPPSTALGFYDPSDDNINLRFFHQKQRFGLDAGYPSSRYVRGLTSVTVPDRTHEVDANGNYVGDQDKYANCTNPLFAASLPTDPTQELCNLPPGPRTPDLVFYATISGVPHQLLQARPGDPECPIGTNAQDCPQKATLTGGDWLKITGKDPEQYDFSGADPHMIESIDPRGTGCPPTANDDCDPINGREWDTKKTDIQFACLFALGQPRDCTQMQFAAACACNGSYGENSSRCQIAGGAHTTTQINDVTTPSITEMVIAHAMSGRPYGDQGIVSSACPIHTVETTTGDPLYGYRPAANAIVARMAPALAH